MAIMTGKQLAEKCIDIAKNYKTIYVMGCFGAPISGGNVTRYCNNHSYNRQRERTSLIKSVANKGYFGFDCVCLIKGILWGWKGDASRTYGGATYTSNGVPDIDAKAMINVCSGISTNFSNIEVGEVVWLDGHIGVYIGDGLAVECSPKWENDVQITAVGNIGKKSGYNTRYWTKHGKLPYVSYDAKAETPKTENKVKGTYTGTLPTIPAKGCLLKGDIGEEVKKLQKFLNWCIDANLEVDGNFGSMTDNAVRAYQKAYDLEVDGKFGAKSLAKAKTLTKGQSTYTGTFPKLPERGYFQMGDKGTQVKNLQKFLNWCMGAGLVVDGEIGAKTTNAVKDFQKTYSLEVDGYFGKKSLNKAKSIEK